MDSVGLAFDSATEAFVDALHGAGLKVIAYTINDPRLMEIAAALGFDGIVSDYPDRIHRRNRATP